MNVNLNWIDVGLTQIVLIILGHIFVNVKKVSNLRIIHA